MVTHQFQFNFQFGLALYIKSFYEKQVNVVMRVATDSRVSSLF